MQTVVSENSETTKETEDNALNIRQRHSRINETHEEVVRTSSIRRDYQSELNERQRTLKNIMQTRDRVLGMTSRIEHRLTQLAASLEAREDDCAIIQQKAERSEALVVRRRSELEELQTAREELKREIEACQSKKRNLMHKLIGLMRASHIGEAQIHQVMRGFDTKLRQLQQAKVQLADQHSDLKLAIANADLAESGRTLVKNEKQQLDYQTITVTEELRRYEADVQQTNIQLSRLLGVIESLQEDGVTAGHTLDRLHKSTREHDTIIRKMQEERDHISNAIETVVVENSHLEADVKARREQITQLKIDIQQRTQDCISVHFQTNGLEKQMKALNGTVALTKRLLDEATVTLLRYKAEEMKLRVIYDEAMKDIMRAKAEHTSIVDVSQMLRRQLSGRQREVGTHATELSTLTHTMGHHGAAFERQTDSLVDLRTDLERGIAHHRSLMIRSSYCHALALEVVALESKISHEVELRKWYEVELTRPMNVHRWTVMKEMAPERYQSIQMTHYLKAKLEASYREKQRLEQQRAALLKGIAQKNERMKHVRIEDGNYALGVMRDSIQGKDRELKSMEWEVTEGRQHVLDLESLVEALKLQVKKAHTAASAIKRKQREDEIPVLPLGPKFLERTRLGGGFDLATSARSGKPVVENDGFENRCSVRRVAAKIAHRAAPATARVESNPSWKPVRAPAPELTVQSARSEADPVRRKPRVSVERQVRRGPGAGDSSSRSDGSSARSSGGSSARSSRSGTDSSRPQVKLHTAVIQF
jgi:chromosome segregation ATPase